MSKRSERHEAERLARRRAYLAQLEANGQTQNPAPQDFTADDITAADILLTTPLPSPARFAANRANAQLSTGPTSAEGKAISSRNHTTHGLTAQPYDGTFKVLANEDQSAYDEALAGYRTEWHPTTATECDLVDRLATHSWLRRRAHRLRDELLSDATANYKLINLYHRYFTTHERAYNKAFSDLMRLRSFQMREQNHQALQARRAQDAQVRFDSQKRKAAEHAAKMENLRLKQEALKHRNQRTNPVPTIVPTTETIEITEIAAAQAA